MRFKRLSDILDLATRLQAARGGLTIDDISSEYAVSRRTAERMRDAADSAFGPLEEVETDDNRKHWRLQSSALRRLTPATVEDLASLATAVDALRGSGFADQARRLNSVDIKLRAMQMPERLDRLDSNLETLVEAEGLAMRPGPCQPIDQDLLALLREAILTTRRIEFAYHARYSGRQSRQKIEPYGLLYGTRPFLVGKNDWSDEARLWRIGNMTEVRVSSESFKRDADFNLGDFARRSFGTFQEPPIRVELLFNEDAAADAISFRFHPDQSVETLKDGTVKVCFKAGGLNEISWHLVTWGDSVTVVKPARLRRHLANLCRDLAEHHLE